MERGAARLKRTGEGAEGVNKECAELVAAGEDDEDGVKDKG